MERYDSGLEAMLVEATNSAQRIADLSLASNDELDLIGMRTFSASEPTDPSDTEPPPRTRTATERCQKTCGGCRG